MMQHKDIATHSIHMYTLGKGYRSTRYLHLPITPKEHFVALPYDTSIYYSSSRFDVQLTLLTIIEAHREDLKILCMFIRMLYCKIIAKHSIMLMFKYIYIYIYY